VRWKQWRADTGDNVWIDFGAVPNEFTGTWYFQWDQNARMYHQQAGGPAANSVPIVAGIWQQVTLTYDLSAGSVTLDVDGQQPVDLTQFFDIGYQIKGLDFQLEGTAFTSASAPEDEPMVSYNTGINTQNGFTLRGGPLAGPDGKMYYFDNVTRELVAVAPQFVKGDSDCDGDVDVNDIGPFVVALLGGQPAWSALGTSTCNFLGGNDYNNDNVVNGHDIRAILAYLLP
jgi:hypothetical protein